MPILLHTTNKLINFEDILLVLLLCLLLKYIKIPSEINNLMKNIEVSRLIL